MSNHVNLTKLFKKEKLVTNVPYFSSRERERERERDTETERERERERESERK